MELIVSVLYCVVIFLGLCFIVEKLWRRGRRMWWNRLYKRAYYNGEKLPPRGRM